jgi:hypothetical protein
LSASAWADDSAEKCIINSDPNWISLNGEHLDITMFGGFAAISISKQKAEEFVARSEAVTLGEAVPFCEVITDHDPEVVTEYTAYYEPGRIELQIFGGFAAFTFCTSDFKSALNK